MKMRKTKGILNCEDIGHVFLNREATKKMPRKIIRILTI